MFESIKAQLFTPSSIVIAILYYMLAVGFTTTYDTFAPMLEQQRPAVGKGK